MPRRHPGLFITLSEEQEVLDATVEGQRYLLQMTERELTEREAEFRRTQDAVAWRIAAYRKERIADLQHVVVWRSRPYYARMDVVADDTEALESYYLSEVLDDSTDMTPTGGALMIHWTVPMARAFAEQPERIRVGTFRGRALLKRRFEIRDLQITDMGDVFSTYSGGEAVGGDPFLGRVLTMAGPRAGNIIRTVGRQQSEAIFDRVPLLVVHGVPGSGKTQIGQMRVAYLVTDAAIDPSRRLAAESCLILSPSRALVAYMEAVLPSFGVRGVQQESVSSWLAAYAGMPIPKRRSGPGRGSAAFAAAQEAWLSRRIRSGIEALQASSMPAGQGWQITAEDVADATGELTDVVYETVRRALGQRLGRRVKDRILRHLQSLWDEGTQKRYKELEAEVDRAVERLVSAALAPLSPRAAYLQFLRDQRLPPEIGEEDLPALALLRFRLTGERLRGLHHVVVDEGQNVSPLAYLVLRQIAPGAGFTILGDLAQCDPETEGLSSWQDLEALGFPAPNVRYLGVNYRSAPAIVDVLNALGPKLGLPFVPIEAVERPAPPVVALALTGDDLAMEDAAARLIAAIPHTTAAVLCRGQERADALRKSLERLLPEGMDQPFVGTRAEAAGLEFDIVLVVGADAATFPDDARAASDLFVLASRAQNRLLLLYREELTPLLAATALRHEKYERDGSRPPAVPGDPGASS